MNRRLHEGPQGRLRNARQSHVPLGVRLVGLAAAGARAEAEHLAAHLRLGEARVAQNVLDRRLRGTIADYLIIIFVAKERALLTLTSILRKLHTNGNRKGDQTSMNHRRISTNTHTS